jgi:cytosine/uracil/thiamine/allantoin permease
MTNLIPVLAMTCGMVLGWGIVQALAKKDPDGKSIAVAWAISFMASAVIYDILKLLGVL